MRYAALRCMYTVRLFQQATAFLCFFFFFFNDTATTEIYTLSLHDALPISCGVQTTWSLAGASSHCARGRMRFITDRKSTRLNSSHLVISYAVFCLKKKKKKNNRNQGHPRHRVVQRMYLRRQCSLVEVYDTS